LEALGQAWEALLAPILARENQAGAPLCLVREGSLFWLCFGSQEAPRSFSAIPQDGGERYARFFHALLKRGVMIAPSAFEVGFLNLAMNHSDLELAAEAFSASLEESR